MVSTFLSYNLVTRDIKSSLDRVASDAVVKRQTEYYRANIGKVKTVDEFLDNYQLYSYAMKAFGLEDMTYAKAFMKKVLESDLSDEKSFANKLSDERYRDFAASFQFSGQEADMQTEAQKDKLLERYNAALASESEKLKSDAFYYESVIDTVSNVSEMVGNKRLMDFVLNAYGIDGKYYAKSHFEQVLTSDLNDPGSYVNQLVANGAANASNFLRMARDFGFQADGSLVGPTAQTAEQKERTASLYVDGEQTYVTDYYRQRERSYYNSKIATITNVTELTSDPRLFSYAKTALKLPEGMSASTFRQIVTSDLNDPGNFAETNGGALWKAAAQQFNFATDGSVIVGEQAQNTTQLTKIHSDFATYYDDADETKKTALIGVFTKQMDKFTTVDEILRDTTTRLVLQRTFVFTSDEFSNSELRKALTSDFTDPNSYANKSKDSRLIEMSRLFNFNEKGEANIPLQAHNTLTATTIAKQFVINESRFEEGEARKTAQKAATEKAEYYQEKIAGVASVSELLADRKIIDVVLNAFGFDPAKVSDDVLKRSFASDLSDPKSFVYTDKSAGGRMAELVASFNFGSDGKLSRSPIGTIQQRGEVMETVNKYMRQTLEENEGESNEAVRLALYFQRTAPTLTDAYDMIADDALMKVFRVSFGYTDDFAKMDVDVQARIVKQKLKLEDFQDPKKVERFIQRFTAMYDSENATIDSSAVNILSGRGGTVSADLLFSLSQLRR